MDSSQRVAELRAKQRRDVKLQESLEEGRKTQIVEEGNAIEEMMMTKGWAIIESHIAKGTNYKRILGMRPSRLMWLQGFMAGLDSVNNLLQDKLAARTAVIKEEMRDGQQ